MCIRDRQKVINTDKFGVQITLMTETAIKSLELMVIMFLPQHQFSLVLICQIITEVLEILLDIKILQLSLIHI